MDAKAVFRISEMIDKGKIVEILSVAQSYAADRAAMEMGVAGIELMENAGRAVADVACAMSSPEAGLLVLCGPGNNGGDGYIAARLLHERGFRVDVRALGDPDRLRGDAAIAFQRYGAAGAPPVTSLSCDIGECHPALVIDALFGAGLARDIEGVTAALIAAISEHGLPVLAVDVPSGIDGDTGQVRGVAFQAQATVTFFRPKPGHYLYPGRRRRGRLHVADIGIPDAVLAAIGIDHFINRPRLWASAWPQLSAETHKYARGHLLVRAGGIETGGAGRLAARAGLRAGAGLVTVAAPPSSLPTHGAHLNAVMLRRCDDAQAWQQMVADKRLRACIIGPGNGIDEATRDAVLAALERKMPVVIDADAISVFSEDPQTLFAVLNEACILTPHEGEFARLFRAEGARIERARAAAAQAGCTVILKGADTLIAAADGRVAINVNAPPTLATAGSGDVLAGICGGLLAQGMEGFAAAAAAVWLHGAAAKAFGPGLIAEDICESLPAALAALQEDCDMMSEENG